MHLLSTRICTSIYEYLGVVVRATESSCILCGCLAAVHVAGTCSHPGLTAPHQPNIHPSVSLLCSLRTINLICIRASPHMA